MVRMLRKRVAGTRWQTAVSRGGMVRALTGMVVALGMGATAFAVLSTVAITHPKPPAQVVAGSSSTPSPTDAVPSPSNSRTVVLPPRCRTTQLAIKTMPYGAYGPGDTPQLFLLRDNGAGDCSLSGAPSISWPQGVEASLQGGLLTAPPANGGRGSPWIGYNGQPLTPPAPIVLTPGGPPAAFITVMYPGPGVKGKWACIRLGQQAKQMPSWLYVTLPGAAHSVAVPSSVLAPSVDPWKQQTCWDFSPATAIYYPATVLAQKTQWTLPSLQLVPTTPVTLPAGTPAFPSS
jgi:hypothetical protein